MRTTLAITAMALSLGACASVGPDYKAPDTYVSPQQKAFVEAKAGLYSSEEAPSQWWTLFNDAALNQIIDEAIKANTDLRVALANLERAEAVLKENKNNRLPTTTVAATVSQGVASAAAQSRAVPFDDARTYDAGFSLAYDPDLFGRLRRAIEGANADADAAKAAYDLALINVIANTARAYADACSSARQIEVAQQSLDMQDRSFKLTERNVKAGRGTNLDITRAKGQLAQIRATVPSLIASQRSALYRLAALMGKNPADYPKAAEACKKPLATTATLPVGDGAMLIKRRPDIRAAERRLASATSSIGVATASLYPSISFGASVGTTAHHLENLDEQNAYRWSIGPLVSWSFPNMTLARTRIAQAEANVKAALATFDGTVLNALRDAETALTTYTYELDRNRELRNARDQNNAAADAARRLLEAGAGSFFEVLDAERTLVSSDAALAASDSALASYRVNLYLALGGGFESRK